MVPAPSGADPQAAGEVQATWLARISTILSLARRGIVVVLHGAHPAAARPLVLALLEGHRPGDPDAPVVKICFTPRELLDVPRGARVVLLGADRQTAWLNFNRPIVHERELVVFVWDTGAEVQTLRREAPDFLDWVSHRIDVPPLASARAKAELHRMVERFRWVAVQGMPLQAAELPGPWAALEGVPPHDELVVALEAGDVVVHGLIRDEDAWRLLLAHAQVQWKHRVLLVDPQVVPPFVALVDDGADDWEALARRLQARGVAHPRLQAALGELTDGGRATAPRQRPRVLEPREPAMTMLRRAALMPTTYRSVIDRAIDRAKVSVHERLGTIAFREGRTLDAQASYEQACRQWEAHDEQPHALARCVAALGDIALRRRDLAEARLHYERARSILEGLARHDLEDLEIQRELSLAYRRHAALLTEQGHLREAAEPLDIAITMTEGLRRVEPERAALERDLAFVLRQRATLWRAQGRPEREQADLDEADALLARFPADQDESGRPLLDLAPLADVDAGRR